VKQNRFVAQSLCFDCCIVLELHGLSVFWVLC
jgi:hypothetical protein